MLIPQAHIAAGLIASAGIQMPQGYDALAKADYVTTSRIEHLINTEDLFDCASDLQDIAYSTPGRNRLMGSEGHNSTVDYIVFELEKTGYFQVRRQPFESVVQTKAKAFMSVDGVDQHANVMSYSPSGTVEKPVVTVSGSGCNKSDFPSEVKGKIALVLRGECPFGVKSQNAAKAGALAAAVYNDKEGELNGTLGIPDRKKPFVPTVAISGEAGLAIKARIERGEEVTAKIVSDSTIEYITTENVIAQTLLGDKDNVLSIGAHTDSVQAGPGINDNGSGTCGLLSVAKALARFRIKNSVIFNFWSGEESGLLGSTHFVKTAPKEELAPVRLYLNFDMIASPNYVYAVYDGDGSHFNKSGPAGSTEAQHFFEEWFHAKGLATVPSDFDGRSDYGPFLEAGIASGGLFTGAEAIKTEREAELFGGEAGVAYDVNYHQKGDTLDNLNLEAFTVNTKAISASVATYAISFKSLNQTERDGTDEYGHPAGKLVVRNEGGDITDRLSKRSAEWAAKRMQVDYQ